MDWTKTLAGEIPNPCYDRPLVCEGVPAASTVMFVGENPGRTTLKDGSTKKNWWSYWSEEHGFDFERFMMDYESQGEIRGSRLRFARARKRFGIKAVETNFYRDEGLGGSKRKVSNRGLIQLLADNMPDLKAVVFHGCKSQALASTVTFLRQVKLIPEDHFRGIGFDKFDALCMRLRG